MVPKMHTTFKRKRRKKISLSNCSYFSENIPGTVSLLPITTEWVTEEKQLANLLIDIFLNFFYNPSISLLPFCLLVLIFRRMNKYARYLYYLIEYMQDACQITSCVAQPVLYGSAVPLCQCSFSAKPITISVTFWQMS